MERVMIIGCGGAGKSTLARQLGEVTGLPVVHLDKLFWKSGWVESSKAEIDEKIRQAAACPRWIMDGNYNRTLEQRLERADTVIYLDFPRMVCLWGVFKRLLTNLGKVRPDMPEGCPEKVDLEFLRWIWNFNKDKRPQYNSPRRVAGADFIAFSSPEWPECRKSGHRSLPGWSPG